MFSNATPPTSLQRTFPGNIGEGISRDAAKNNPKKTRRIIVPLIVFTLLPSYVFDVSSCASTGLSCVAIFNKPSRILVEQQYTLTIDILNAENSHEEID